MKYKMSIVVPVFNAGAFLHDFFNSILAQSFRDFELILIDDGSTDGSVKIIDSYISLDSRIRLFQQMHAGVGAARNRGISVAQGEFIAFLDADDYFETDFLESMYQVAKRDNSEIVICGYYEFNDERRKPTREWRPKAGKYSRKDLQTSIFQRANPTVWNKIFLKTLVDREALVFQNIFSCNDVYFVYCAMAAASSISYIDKSYVWYRKNHSNSISRNRGEWAINLIHSFNAVKIKLLESNTFLIYKHSFDRELASSMLYELKFMNGMCSRVSLIEKVLSSFGFVILLYAMRIAVQKLFEFMKGRGGGSQ